MRFRSFGISASNMDEYLSKIKAQEAEYIEESTLSQLNYFNGQSNCLKNVIKIIINK